jgi:hypothetical protein
MAHNGSAFGRGFHEEQDFISVIGSVTVTVTVIGSVTVTVTVIGSVTVTVIGSVTVH